MKTRLKTFVKKHTRGCTLLVTCIMLVSFLALGVIASVREPVLSIPCLILVALSLYSLGRIKEVCVPSLDDLQDAFNGLRFDEVDYDDQTNND